MEHKTTTQEQTEESYRMRLIRLELPEQDYDALITTGRAPAQVRARLGEVLAELGGTPALFGKSRSADGLAPLLARQAAAPDQSVEADRVPRMDSADVRAGDAAPCTGLVLAAHPAHYDNILATLRQSGRFADVPVILPFAHGTLDVALVLETQPRSGTHYTLNNLMACTGWNYASVFTETGTSFTPDGLINYTPADNERPYVVKSHFSKPLHYPRYRFVKSAFLYGWFFDSYFSLGRLRAGKPEGYRLRADSHEWTELRGMLPLHRNWLDYIARRFCVCYERYADDFAGQIARLEAFTGHDLSAFEPPRMSPSRTYWSGDYAGHFDDAVLAELLAAFAPHVVSLYPEKLDEMRELAGRLKLDIPALQAASTPPIPEGAAEECADGPPAGSEASPAASTAQQTAPAAENDGTQPHHTAAKAGSQGGHS